MRYRDGDDDLTVDVQPADANDAWAVLPSAIAPPPPPPPTLFPPRSSSPSPATGPAAEADARQVDMDEYIEYLERRYSRIHRATTTTTVVLDHRIARGMFPSRMLDRGRTSVAAAPPPASAPSASRRVVAPPQGGECDHLSVLGLSGLASAGLRRKLNGASSPPSSRKSRGLLRLLLLDRARSTATALASSFRIATDFFLMTIAPGLLEGSTFGLPVTSFAVLLLVRPLLRWRHFGQG